MEEAKQSKLNDKGPFIGQKLFNKYILVQKLGEGSFGSIYSAKENNNWYAIKFENKNKGQNLLENEAYIMSYLKSPRIPLVKSFGYSGDYNVLIMELMGKSLEDLFENLPNKKMTVRCVCNLGFQMMEIMEYIHNKHIIHRDIKPDNFVMGKGVKSKYLYILDFGLSKKYRSASSLKHYPLTKRKKLTGTARYASVNALNGITQSRRDDLEAIGYVLMYFLIGKLPWQGLVNKNKDERYLRIMEVKRDTTPEQLCKGFPREFEEYITYTRNLEYEQDPDYDLLKNLFLKVLRDEGYNFDYYNDWDNDVTTMTTADTNFNLVSRLEVEKNFKNKLSNEPKNELRNDIKKNKDKNDNNNDNKSDIKEKENENENERINDSDKKRNKDDINNKEKEVAYNKKSNSLNKNILNDENNNKLNDNSKENEHKKEPTKEIVFDSGFIYGENFEKGHKNNSKYSYRNNNDNKCCIIF